MAMIFGDAGNNVLFGTDFADTIDGGAGADNMFGGKGDDVYIVDDLGDMVQELFGEGTDLVRSSVSFVLGANVENLTLEGSDNIYGYGNTGANVITGNSGSNFIYGDAGNDSLIGNAGDDWLIGGTGSDVMTGGVGNDIYFVENTLDKVVETVAGAAGGFDIVFSDISFSIANLLNVEALGLAAGTGNTSATGNKFDNVLVGNEGDNMIDGGQGGDNMTGGAGNDTYIVDSTLDTITEYKGEGTDTIISSIALTLPVAEVENYVFNTAVALNFVGSSVNNDITGGTGDDIIFGNGGTRDRIWGNTGNDILMGGTGNDELDGGTGADRMTGGSGNDTYIVDSTGDQVYEVAGGGYDEVRISVSMTSLLFDNVEQVTLLGNANLNAFGNDSGNNVIIGNSGANQIDGRAGDDTLYGMTGNDTLTGNLGRDTFVFNESAISDGRDTIVDFNRNEDSLNFASVGDQDHNGVLNLADLLLDVTSVVDGGLFRDVTVSFANGSAITFAGAGTGSIHALTDLVADPAQIQVVS